MDISFSTQQVVDSEEHRLLMALRDGSLNDEGPVELFFQRVIESLVMEGQYLILLAYDAYDVPYRSQDGETQGEASSEIFSYLLCSVCPVKMTKPTLCYYVPENVFHSMQTDWVVAPPELGFLSPAFEDRSANIYGALYYTRNIAEIHQDFVDAVFRTQAPMPAAEQQETFRSILAETLADDCSFDVVQSVHDQFTGMIEEHKANKVPQPLAVSKRTVKGVLASCGVPEERVAAFDEKYDAAFGADAEIPPQNIVDVRQFKLRTPDVTIQVNPERGDLVETRVIDGLKYILIRAEEGVEVNGVSIHISQERTAQDR